MIASEEELECELLHKIQDCSGVTSIWRPAGDQKLARDTAKLIGSDDLLRKRLAVLVRGHFGLDSSVLKV
jgi:hypothetical protein